MKGVADVIAAFKSRSLFRVAEQWVCSLDPPLNCKGYREGDGPFRLATAEDKIHVHYMCDPICEAWPHFFKAPSRGRHGTIHNTATSENIGGTKANTLETD